MPTPGKPQTTPCLGKNAWEPLHHTTCHGTSPRLLVFLTPESYSPSSFCLHSLPGTPPSVAGTVHSLDPSLSGRLLHSGTPPPWQHCA